MKKIIIIGASSGLGRRVAEDFAAQGWKVGIAARSIDKLRQLEATAPESFVSQEIDVTAKDAPEQLEALIHALGGMDVLFLASGVGFANPDLEMSKDRNICMVNVVGFTMIIDAAYKYFKLQGHGHIAAITSVAGTMGMGQASAYSASKTYQQRYLQAIAQLARMQRIGLKITDIRPGFVRTPLLDDTKHYPLIMTVDHAAPLIEKAIIRAKRVAYIDWKWRVVTALWRLIPSWLWERLKIKN